MADRLLDRQLKLLEHLTGAAAIFGTDRDAIERAPQGIHGGLLHLEARFSHEKRMAKIERVLGRTLDLLGTAKPGIIRHFAEACPPTSISRLENARQLHRFLLVRWQAEPPEPPYLPDVAAFEVAFAAVRAGEASHDDAAAPSGAVRRHPGAALLRCRHDIRPVLRGRVGELVPACRETYLCIAMPPATVDPVVSELSPGIFALLERLEHFLDPTLFEDAPEVADLVADLAARGFLEVHR
jgi:hypothetical protein